MKTMKFILCAIALQTCFAGSLFGQASNTPPKKAESRGAWQVKISRSEMTDDQNVTLSLAASKSIQGDFGQILPKIIIRCKEGGLDAYINTGFVLDSNLYDNSDVRIRWDESEPKSESWNISTDHQAVFSKTPSEFINYLLLAKKLRFEFDPFDRAPIVATFNVSGLSTHLDKLEKACPNMKASDDSK